MSSCICQVCECLVNFVFWLQLEFLLVPKHCQVTSKLFTIKPVHTHPHSYDEVTSLNIIYKIEGDHLLLESVESDKDSEKTEGNRILTKLKVPSKMILNQINKTRQRLSLANTQSTFKLSGKITTKLPSCLASSFNVFIISDHFEPLSITGTTLGGLSVTVVVIFGIFICIRLL